MSTQINTQVGYPGEPDENFDLEPAQAQVNPLDDILDEIDLILEENTQDFVNAFVQKGGE